MYDLIIRNGTIVDGTGAAAFVGDIAVDGDRIVQVGKVAGSARREIDASGQIVTPGWVDIHTHYDGQATWCWPPPAGMASPPPSWVTAAWASRPSAPTPTIS